MKDSINNNKFLFAAINPYIQTNDITPTETDSRKGFVTWGTDNCFPFYLENLYNTVPTLHSIIEGSVDFVTGNNIEFENGDSVIINSRGEALSDLVRNISRDYFIYGGFAINVVRNDLGTITGLYYLDFSTVRCSEDRTQLYYSKDWSKSRSKYLVYPRFESNKITSNSIYYYTTTNKTTYPSPLYSASLKNCEIERNVTEYFYNSLYNGFSANTIVSLNNGIPNDEQKEEIEEYFNDKYSGYGNASRTVFIFSPDKEHSPEITTLSTDDFSSKFNALSENCKQSIFTSFRALPQLFGINLNTGFSTQEYDEAFRLYNRTVIRPIQNVIKTSIERILNKKINITPFTLD